MRTFKYGHTNRGHWEIDLQLSSKPPYWVVDLSPEELWKMAQGRGWSGFDEAGIQSLLQREYMGLEYLSPGNGFNSTANQSCLEHEIEMGDVESAYRSYASLKNSLNRDYQRCKENIAVLEEISRRKNLNV